MRHPHVLQLIMDSLRYWVTEMHVDGFRFDLAATLARQFHEVDRLSAFFDLVQQDPVVSQVKLIAEPWDVGEGGYQVGNFPPLWTEWNGKYRDTVRDFWRGEPATLAEFASRLTGSSDLYQGDGRRPVASINFVTAHDGFTLRRPGLLQREAQRGQRRGQPRRREPQPVLELRRRGPDRRRRRCCALRARQQRNFLATLLLSQGVPMLLARRRARPHPARQQQRLLPGQRDLLGGLGTEPGDRTPNAGPAGLHPAADRAAAEPPGVPPPALLPGRAGPRGRATVGDIAWFTPGGEEMTDEDWAAGFAKSLTVFLNGDAHPRAGPARPAGSSTTRSCCCSTPARADWSSPSRPPGTASSGSVVLDTAPARRSGRPGQPAASPPPRRAAARPGDTIDVLQPARCQVLPACLSRPPRPTGCSCTPGSASPTPPPRRLPGRARRHPRATCRRSCRPRPARRTATTSSTTPRSRPTWAARAGSGPWPRRCAATASASSSTWCPTTWACRPRSR